jgi:hypothetical protein
VKVIIDQDFITAIADAKQIVYEAISLATQTRDENMLRYNKGILKGIHIVEDVYRICVAYAAENNWVKATPPKPPEVS